MMKTMMTIQAPAKVNLTLRILGKRSDGFHDIETLMVPVSLADEIDISIAEGAGVDLQCDDPTIPIDGGNLVSRAVNVFANHTGLDFRAVIHLRKRIPCGAGLGGGSSDAAAVLKALNSLLATNLNIKTLEKLGGALGSDVPFFIRARPALCYGRGEIVKSIHNWKSSRSLLLVKPPFPVPTAWAYQAWSQYLEREPLEKQFLNGVELINEFEPPVFAKYSLLPVLKNWLRSQPEVECAMMSGSGSTVFAVMREISNSLIERIHQSYGYHTWTYSCEMMDAG